MFDYLLKKGVLIRMSRTSLEDLPSSSQATMEKLVRNVMRHAISICLVSTLQAPTRSNYVSEWTNIFKMLVRRSHFTTTGSYGIDRIDKIDRIERNYLYWSSIPFFIHNV